MSATATPEYRPGDKVRVLADKPYATELAAGDVVTVIEQKTKVEEGEEVEVVLVATSSGNRWLGLDVVEPFVNDYAPAEPDEKVDAAFRALLDADKELAAWAETADTALGAEDEKVSTALAGESWDETAVSPGPGSRFRVIDYAGDVMEIHYVERQCPTHGREGAFLFEGDLGAIVIPADSVGPVIAFLLDRARFSKRPGDVKWAAMPTKDSRSASSRWPALWSWPRAAAPTPPHRPPPDLPPRPLSKTPASTPHSARTRTS